MNTRQANKVAKLFLNEMGLKHKISTKLKAGRIRQRMKHFKRYNYPRGHDE